MTLAATALLIWGCAYASVAAYAVGRRALAAGKAPAISASRGASEPRVLLVRPCAGREPDLHATLASSVADPAPSYVRFALATRDDGAADTARAVAAELSALGHDVEVQVTGARGPNQKADQVARVLADAPAYDVLVIADSDVRLATGDVRLLVDSIAAGASAAWSPPIEEGPPRSLGDVLSRSVLRATLHAFPILAALDPAGLVGKLLAVRRDSLEAVGSFTGLVGYLGEDMELARRLRERGERIVVCGIARARPRGRTVWGAVDRYARWIGVIRSQRPRLMWTYPPLFFGALPAAVVALLIGGSTGLTAGGLFLGGRVAIALAAAPGRWRHPVEAVVEAALGDAVLALAFGKALSTRTISWRGATLRLGRATLEVEER